MGDQRDHGKEEKEAPSRIIYYQNVFLTKNAYPKGGWPPYLMAITNHHKHARADGNLQKQILLIRFSIKKYKIQLEILVIQPS